VLCLPSDKCENPPEHLAHHVLFAKTDPDGQNLIMEGLKMAKKKLKKGKKLHGTKTLIVATKVFLDR
jgi:hypothetical protein